MSVQATAGTKIKNTATVSSANPEGAGVTQSTAITLVYRGVGLRGQLNSAVPAGLIQPEKETADPSTSLRSGRDDKGKGGASIQIRCCGG